MTASNSTPTEAFAAKLIAFKRTLTPAEQRLFVKILRTAKEATGDELVGLDGARDVIDDLRELENLPWTSILSLDPHPVEPANPIVLPAPGQPPTIASRETGD